MFPKHLYNQVEGDSSHVWLSNVSSTVRSATAHVEKITEKAKRFLLSKCYSIHSWTWTLKLFQQSVFLFQPLQHEYVFKVEKTCGYLDSLPKNLKWNKIRSEWMAKHRKIFAPERAWRNQLWQNDVVVAQSTRRLGPKPTIGYSFLCVHSFLPGTRSKSNRFRFQSSSYDFLSICCQVMRL